MVVFTAGIFIWLCASAVRAGAGELPPLSTCLEDPKPLFCDAARGSRPEGWLRQGRAEVIAQHGMVVTSQPLAAQAGLDILKKGGNAFDAAVATAAVLNLVEPMNVGMGGDLFAILYSARDKTFYALNASGRAPSGATIEHLNALGYKAASGKWDLVSGMPFFGILPVTVPGAVWGWEAVLKRFGTMTFKQVLQAAVDYAEHGFPVSERVAFDWVIPPALPTIGCCKEQDPDSIRTWMIDGKRPGVGQIFRNPDLAKSFRLLQKYGAAVFYRGEIARAIVAKSNALGGTMTLEDLAAYEGVWSKPVITTYRGFEIAELPPPSQDWAANEMLNILEACVPVWSPEKSLRDLGPNDPHYWHFLVEAKKLAYRDLYRYNADPSVAHVPIERLLSKSYAGSLCGKVDANRASETQPADVNDAAGDTIVLSAGDSQGNMVSWVNSNFAGFGSGVTVPGYGFILHDRGALFSLDPKSPNALAPHKQPYNTLSAGFMLHDGKPVMTLTLMGGDMQAQGHAQLVVNLLDLGANTQAAAELARFIHHEVSNELDLEGDLYDRVGPALAAMGHKVKSVDGGALGGVQTILLDPTAKSNAPSGWQVPGIYRGASDPRKDGEAVGW